MVYKLQKIIALYYADLNHFVSTHSNFLSKRFIVRGFPVTDLFSFLLKCGSNNLSADRII